MKQVYVESVSLQGPGLDGWKKSLPILTGKASYKYEDIPKLSPSLLPANERRRTTSLIKIALQVAQDALADKMQDSKNYATVFAASDGDIEIIHRICTALMQPGKPVSPTHFHNSVHNAPAGYWAIAANAQLASTSISAADFSFGAGLLEAVTFAACEQQPVLFVAYDVPVLMEPLASARPMYSAFATAMVISPTKTTDSVAALKCSLKQSGVQTVSANKELEKLRIGNPAARSLPLLETFSCNADATVQLPAPHETILSVEVSACPK